MSFEATPEQPITTQGNGGRGIGSRGNRHGRNRQRKKKVTIPKDGDEVSRINTTPSQDDKSEDMKSQRNFNQERGRGSGRGHRRRRNSNRTTDVPNADSTVEEQRTDSKSKTVENVRRVEAIDLPKCSILSDPSCLSSARTEWLMGSLKALGHPNPEMWNKALQWDDHDNEHQHHQEWVESVSDEHFFQITMWLEDRFIRFYDIQERNEKLRNHRISFWNNLSFYLQELECPPSYYALNFMASDQISINREECDSKPDFLPQRITTTQRLRILFWLISCATAEAYGDRFPKLNNQNDCEIQGIFHNSLEGSNLNLSNAVPSTTSPTYTTEEKKPSEVFSSALDSMQYPLGFSTGDKEVDQILTILRMQLIRKLELQQQEINSIITSIQKQSCEKGTKELKPYTLRGSRQR